MMVKKKKAAKALKNNKEQEDNNDDDREEGGPVEPVLGSIKIIAISCNGEIRELGSGRSVPP